MTGLRPANTALAGACLAGVVLVAAGCEDRVLQTGLNYHYVKGYFEDEPAVAPSPIRPLSGRNPDYPTLYTVPMRPVAIPTQIERKAAIADQQKAVDALESDRRAGHSADEQLQEVAPPPLPVPPAPVTGGPGGASGPAASSATTTAKPAKPAKPPAGP